MISMIVVTILISDAGLSSLSDVQYGRSTLGSKNQGSEQCTLLWASLRLRVQVSYQDHTQNALFGHPAWGTDTLSPLRSQDDAIVLAPLCRTLLDHKCLSGGDCVLNNVLDKKHIVALRKLLTTPENMPFPFVATFYQALGQSKNAEARKIVNSWWEDCDASRVYDPYFLQQLVTLTSYKQTPKTIKDCSLASRILSHKIGPTDMPENCDPRIERFLNWRRDNVEVVKRVCAYVKDQPH